MTNKQTLEAFSIVANDIIPCTMQNILDRLEDDETFDRGKAYNDLSLMLLEIENINSMMDEDLKICYYAKFIAKHMKKTFDL